MRVQFQSEGGLAVFPGLQKLISIDVDALPASDANRLRQLVRAASFFDLPAHIGTPPRGAADMREYTLTIEDGGRRHTVVAPHDHWRCADLALGDPADVVLEKPRGQLQGAAEVAVFETGELGTGRGRRAHAPYPTATDAGADHSWRIWDGATRRPTAARTSTSSRRLVARVIRSFAGVLQAVAGPQCKPHDQPGAGARGELRRDDTW